VRTPAFMPVGTQATVKAMYPDQVRELGADVVLGNTYHLMLRPGAERSPVSAGCTIHELAAYDPDRFRRLSGHVAGAIAQARRGGRDLPEPYRRLAHHMTPERSVEIQGLLGSDIQMQLDECIALPAPREDVERAMRLSLRWAERSRNQFEPWAGLSAVRRSMASSRAATCRTCSDPPRRNSRNAVRRLFGRRPRRRRAAGRHAEDA
jgi:queuine tRNA-ribosyltransferase